MIFISFSEAYARLGNKNYKFNYKFKKRLKNIFYYITKWWKPLILQCL